MAPNNLSKRHALLVGVNLYMNDGSRKTVEGATVSLKNLQGCKNDVDDIKDMLAVKFGITEACVLTASASPDTTTTTAPSEPETQRPTYANIVRHFDRILATARANDVFFFHFSGHGAQLKATKASPSGRLLDPCLLPMDFCCGQPAIPGWQLNIWLHQLHKARVQVIVSLDSCHSGGSWRAGGNMRTVDKTWEPPSVLLGDEEEAAKAARIGSESRDCKQLESWDINPSRFTLMAACKPDQYAREDWHRGRMCGAYTSALVSCLGQSTPLETYRTLREKIELAFGAQARSQTPQTYGRDRLVFLGSREPFSSSPICIRVEGGRAKLPIGSVHGVKRGMEYTAMAGSLNVPLTVDHVDDLHSTAITVDKTALSLQTGDEVFCSRWSTPEPFRLQVDPGTTAVFCKSLLVALQQRVSGPVEVVLAGPEDHLRHDIVGLKVMTDYSTLVRFDPHTGTDELVHGLQIPNHNAEEYATKSAVAAAHLFRFQQLCNMKTEASTETAPFGIMFEQYRPLKRRLSNGETLQSKAKVRFTFENRDSETLYLTVMVLGPGYHVRQIYPQSDRAHEVASSGKTSFGFQLYLPNELRGGRHRDIIRCIITKSKTLSFKSLELPDIWEAGHLFDNKASPERNARLMMEDFEWWISDFQLWTQD